MNQKRLREVIYPGSLLPYLLWRAGIDSRPEKRVRLKSGEKLVLRRPPSNDLGNAMEVFLFGTYESPKPLLDLKRIVDLGANVGYSVVYFARKFPQAEITAWEPHPAHVQQLEANILANSLRDRVTIYPLAAGTQNQTKWLIDQGTSSRVVDSYVSNSVKIQVGDWLDDARTATIDLLKMDIEGGEYDLLFDQRFEALNIPRIVVEWHCNPDRPHGDLEVNERLRELGYELHACRTAEVGDMRAGMLWAFRENQ